MILTFLFIQHLTLNVVYLYLYSTTIWKITILNVFEICPLKPGFSLFDEKYRKNNNIVKYC